MNIEGKFYFAKLMEEQVFPPKLREVMNTEVKEGAKPEEVKLVAINKPEVKVPEQPGCGPGRQKS